MQSLLISIFILCGAVSFLMSGMEVGVFALSPLRIRQQMRAGNRRAQALYGYLEDPEDFLWTILIGNTVANVTIVTIGFLGLYQLLGEWLPLFLLALLCAGILFYAICELLPKMLFRLYPTRLCLMLTFPFRAVHFTVRPLVVLMSISAQSLLRWSGGRKFTGRLFGTRDELRVLMQESAQGLTSEERAMINHVLDLQNLTVGQIAIPLSKTVMVSAQTLVSELLSIYREKGFNRLPIWSMQEGRRRIIGFVSMRSLLFSEELDLNKTAGDHLKPALFLSAEMRLEAALRQMQRTGHRLGIVLGRDRAELGLISLEDILHVIFGQVRL
jgi:CBS domain containing-hemolysin-like protein